MYSLYHLLLSLLQLFSTSSSQSVLYTYLNDPFLMSHTPPLTFHDFLDHTTRTHPYIASASYLYAGSTFTKPQIRQFLAEYLNKRLVMTGFSPVLADESNSDYETRNLRKYISCKVAKDIVIQSGIGETITIKEVEQKFFKEGMGYQIG